MSSVLYWFAALFGALFVLAIFVSLVGGIYYSRRRHRILVSLKCPKCHAIYGETAIADAASRNDEHTAEYIANLDVGPNTSVDVQFRDILPLICPQCGHECDVDIDSMLCDV
jgi:hypothetical protein